MADMSTITLDNTVYNIKDVTAREEMSGMRKIFVGNQTPSEAEEGDLWFCSNKNVSAGGWERPAEWDDLSSITLPDSTTVNTLYLLYDRSCGSDEVSFRTISKMTAVYKGHVSNGVFTGDLVASNVTSYTDTLTENYTVYKIEYTGNFWFNTLNVTSNYSYTVQGVVWIYGEIPTTTQIGGSTSTQIALSLYTKLFHLEKAIVLNNITLSGNIAYPEIEEFYISVNDNGDFDSNAISRTGNGLIWVQPFRNEEEFVFKNVEMDLSTGRMQAMRRVVFSDGTSGTIANQSFQSSYWLLSVVFESGSDYSCTSLYQEFRDAFLLEVCDLRYVDFSAVTNTGNAFYNCQRLKDLYLNDTLQVSFNIGPCNSLTIESMRGILNTLPTVTSTQTITIPYYHKTYGLTSAEIAIATQKGWTVA